MGSLNGILSTGHSSLLAHQNAISVASNNTANAATPGFSKRDIQLIAISGSGVAIDSIRRRADSWIQQRMLRERSRLGTQEAEAQSMTALELQFGDDAGGIGSALDGFFAAVSQLAASPTDAVARADMLATGRVFAETLGVNSQRVEAERRVTDDRLELETARINQITQELAELNGRIPSSEAASQEASADRDRRDSLLLELASFAEISVIDHRDGTMSVLLSGSRPIVQGTTAARLEAVPDAGLGGLRRIDYVSSEGLRTEITTELGGGTLGGLVGLRDGLLADVQDRLDQLAFDVATAFNAQHAAGFGSDGLSGRNFFEPLAGVAGAAQSLTLAAGIEQNPDWIAAASTAASAQGGNDNLLLLSALSESPIAAGGLRTGAQEVADIVGTVGREVASSRAEAVSLSHRFEQVQAMNDAQTGVSVDEELIDITRFERAYQAAARIIQTVDDMFDTVLSL